MFWTINTWKKKQTNKQTNKNNNMFYMQSGLSYLRYELRLFPLKLLISKTSHRPGHTLPNTRRHAVSFEREMLVKNVIVFPHVSRYFWIRNFSFAHSSPTRIRCNPHLSSCIRSPESKCWIRYEIRIFFHQCCQKIKPSSLQWIFKALPCAVLWLLYFLDFNLKLATRWRTESDSGYV